jgi:hypothetical protein
MCTPILLQEPKEMMGVDFLLKEFSAGMARIKQ